MNLFKSIIPCTGSALNLLEQIINEIIIYFNPNNDKIDFAPLQVILLLFKLISF